MSKFWSNIFGKKTTPKEEVVEEERGPHMPPKELPIEQTFAKKFTACGGKFVYCETLQDAKDAYLSFVNENIQDFWITNNKNIYIQITYL